MSLQLKIFWHKSFPQNTSTHLLPKSSLFPVFMYSDPNINSPWKRTICTNYNFESSIFTKIQLIGHNSNFWWILKASQKWSNWQCKKDRLDFKHCMRFHHYIFMTQRNTLLLWIAKTWTVTHFSNLEIEATSWNWQFSKHVAFTYLT